MLETRNHCEGESNRRIQDLEALVAEQESYIEYLEAILGAVKSQDVKRGTLRILKLATQPLISKPIQKALSLFFRSSEAKIDITSDKI